MHKTLIKFIIFFLSTSALFFFLFAFKADNEFLTWIDKELQYFLALEFFILIALLYKMTNNSQIFSNLPKTTTIIVLLLLMIFTITREPPGFKVTYDEQVLSATAMNMHYNRIVGYPNTGYELNGRYEIMDLNFDKRPAFFPFLTSLVHDISGYRINNAFYLNMLLASLAVLLLFLINRTIADENAAIFSVAIFCMFPLVSQNASGGGFEVLNITMLLLSIWLSIIYIQKPDPTSALALCISVILLSQTRYESILYIPFVVLVLALGWKKEKKFELPYSIMLLPVFFIPVFAHLGLLWNDTEAWQVAENDTATFSTDYLSRNIAGAIKYFFTIDPNSSSNIIFSILGLFAVPVMLVSLAKKFNPTLIKSPTPLMVTGIFLLAIIAHFLVILLYHDGNLSVKETHRYALPLMVAFSISIAFLLKNKIQSNRSKLSAIFGIVIAAYIFSFPAFAKHIHTNTLSHQKRANWLLSHLNHLPNKDYLLIIHDPWQFILHKIPATKLDSIDTLANKINYHLEQQTFSNIYIVQDYVTDPATGLISFAETDYLDNRFKLREISRIKIDILRSARISVIEEINAEAMPVPADQIRTYPRNKRPPIELKTYNKWINNLF